MKTVGEITDKAEVFVIEKNYIHSGLADRPRIISWIAEFAVAHANDAIADTKAFYESLFAELKQSDLQLVEIYAQAEVGRLQAEKKNAALVAALDRTKRYCESGSGRGGATLVGNDWINEGEGTLYDSVLTALAANEKGGKCE